MTVFEISFGGYATPTKYLVFWRLALNKYNILLYYPYTNFYIRYFYDKNVKTV